MKISAKFTKPNWNLNNLLFGAISSLLIFVGILSFALLNSTTQLEELEINRHKLILLGTELKESSDELTRLCRTYVVTGESKWENQYWQLLDVRNGIKPWPNGSKIALHDSLIKLGIAPLENQKLLLAEKNSNDLVWTERVAFNAMKGIFADSLKHFTIMSKPNPLFAQKIMFDKKYIEDKEKIMRPIGEFRKMLDQRISYEIDRQKSKNKSLLIVIILTIAAISALSFYTIFILRKILIQQNKELDHKVAERDKELNLRYQELKQNHIKLGEAEQKFRSLVENSLVGVYIAPEGKLAYVNPKFQEIFEYEYDELIGKDIYSLIYPEDVAIAKEKVRLREEKKVDGVQYEIRCITKTGRIIWIELFGSITLYNGNPALSGTLLDITESKTAQDEVKKRESEFRAFFDNLESASCLLDADKKYVLFNRRFAQDYFNLTNVEPKPGMEAYDFFPPEVKIARNLVIDRVMQTGKKEDIEVDYHKHGKFISYRTSFNPVLKDGKVIGIATLSVDLTQIKQVKAEIIKSQANMKSILDNTEVGFLLLDINYHVITSNKRFDNGYAKAFGIDFKKDVSYFKQIDEDRIETVLDYFERVKTQRISVGWESSVNGTNGLFYFNINLMPVMDEDEIIGFSMAATDITERKSLEIEREQITDDLMQRNKDLEQFAYITSHNLRAPIANIIGISELLEEPAVLEDERKDLNQSLIYSVSRLDQVVADLNIILQTKREIDETKKNVNLYDLVSLVKDSIKNLIEHNDVSIICRFDQGAKEFFTIKTYLYSIFYNLISNSIKYRKQNQPCLIQIESKIVGNKLILVFKDNGIGINLEKYGEKVFKLYKRFHLNIEGKGMGLYMVKTQVETLGGKISISSQPDVGTEFVIEFPM